jgi:hypothetical protein
MADILIFPDNMDIIRGRFQACGMRPRFAAGIPKIQFALRWTGGFPML